MMNLRVTYADGMVVILHDVKELVKKGYITMITYSDNSPEFLFHNRIEKLESI